MAKFKLLIFGLSLGLVQLIGFSGKLWAQEANEELTLLVHPTYTPDLSDAVHQPLVDYLSRSTGRKIRLVTPRDFHKYWIDTQAGEFYHLVLEDSHIADYRRMLGTHEPIARGADDIRYLVLSSDPLVRQKEHLIGLRISTMSSPSLGYQMLSRWFNNPMAQPQILSNSKSLLDSVEMVFAAESDAAVVPEWLGERYPNLTPVLQSDPIPGLTLSIANDLDSTLRESILEAMLALDENSQDYQVLNELNVRHFVAAKASDYEGLSELLSSLYSTRTL